MTQEDIISMAKESGMMVFEDGSTNCYYHDLERFAKLVAEKEREACAKIGDGYHDNEANCGDLIRARGQQ